MADLILRVNGKEFAGWKTARVTRGIEAISGSFELAVSERWAEAGKLWPIHEEDECSLVLGKTTVITGWVDKRKLSYNTSDHTLTISGRDKTGALVDNSAILKSWEFKSVDLLTLAKHLADPFGITVTMDAALAGTVASLHTGKAAGSVSTAGSAGKRSGLGLPKPPKKFTVDPGESAFEVLDRACRMAGVLPISDGKGGLLLTRPGSDRASTELVEGQNILAASADFDASTVYRRYVVKAQHHGSDDFFGASVAAVSAEATDESVKRASRVLLIRPEGSATVESAKVRAAWEAKIRSARASAVSITVQGWEQGNGAVWPVNANVRVRSPRLGVDGDLVITQATYNVSAEEGKTTELTLKRPDAFLPEPKITASAGALFFTGAVKGTRTGGGR